VASIISKKVKKYTYYYLVESARVNGKPRIVSQRYLGSAERILSAIDKLETDIPEPKYSIVLEFGAVAALYNTAKKLEVIKMIDKHVNKRNQGLSVGEYLVLAAINRAVSPCSKNSFFKWFEYTVLPKFFPRATKKALSSQRFWDNMSLVTDEAIDRFEEEFTKLMVSKYELNTDCLLYDNTNFFTYIDTKTDSELAERGKSKEKRTDLRIVGMSMMISAKYNVPLFYEVYPGNKNDAKQFSDVMEELKKRYEAICGEERTVTLVFDKGNNSLENIQSVVQDCENNIYCRFVGSLKFNQCRELLEIPKKEYSPLKEKALRDCTAYRTEKEIYGQTMTVIVVNNPELIAGQLQGISNNVNKCQSELLSLQLTLEKRANGIITKGKTPTVNSVEKKVKKILSKDYMKDIFSYDVYEVDKNVRLQYTFDSDKLSEICESYLGKTILFTNNHNWSNERIILAYRSQYHIEDNFKQMKDTEYLSFRPQNHWTDQKIKVHAFYCVLGLRLCCLLNLELSKMGYKMSINKMLETLSDVQQVITVFPEKKNNKERKCSSVSSKSKKGTNIVKKMDLDKYQVVV
jgi:transposase